MMDSGSVITHAVDGIVKDLAADYEVSLPRMYELLGPQCCYPKAKRLIRAIARHSPAGARLIEADIGAMFADILGEAANVEAPTVKHLHKEAYEAIDSLLSGDSPAEQIQELRELVAIAQQMIEGREKLQERGSLRPVA